MKKSIVIGMMTIMMVLCTTVSFAQGHNYNRNNNRGPRTEMRRHHDNRPVAHPATHHQMRPHRHVIGRHHRCNVCGLTKQQIRRMERQMHKPAPHNRPAPHHRPHRR